jgi:hypothetical protein
MNITYPVELTLARRMHGMRNQLGWIGWLFRLAGVGFAVGGIIDHFPPAAILALVFLLYPEAVAVVVHLRAKKFGRVFTYTLTDEVIRVTNAVSSVEVSWDLAKPARESASDWYFPFTGGGGAWVPKGAFTPEQDAEWRAFLVGRGLVRT